MCSFIGNLCMALQCTPPLWSSNGSWHVREVMVSRHAMSTSDLGDCDWWPCICMYGDGFSLSLGEREQIVECCMSYAGYRLSYHINSER